MHAEYHSVRIPHSAARKYGFLFSGLLLEQTMANGVQIFGVHPLAGEEPVHLIELRVTGDLERFDFGEITQQLPGQPPENWQTAYDERLLTKDGDTATYALFFHYLRRGEPLLTSFGPVSVPEETPAPDHL